MKMQQPALMFVLALTLCGSAFAGTGRAENSAVDKAIDRITQRETVTVKNIAQYSPLVETYVQTFASDKDLGHVPNGDHYFLGRASFQGAFKDDSFVSDSPAGVRHKLLSEFEALKLKQKTTWVPLGFAQAAVLDATEFDRAHYTFTFQRREMLGNVRCIVFDVSPTAHTGHGRFLGRIWVEDQDYTIVRFNGTFVHPKDGSTFLHFDSWRINVAPSVWLPAYIYGEESSLKVSGSTVGIKSQTRFWGYSKAGAKDSEFTDVLIDTKDAATTSAQPVASPVTSERNWERQAEDNVLDRLEQAGLLAPASDLDRVLQTVVDNILITNNLSVDPQVRCRVLLTQPLDTFAVGHTIVISRGLLDVLPDEASLAAALTESLSHILLGHSLDTKFAFSDRLQFSDTEALKRLSMVRSPDDEAAADKKTVELLQNSPYKDKLAGVSLFMTQLAAIHGVLPNLAGGRLGNALAGSSASAIDPNAPKLDRLDTKQIAALPLGSRIVVDPWTDHATMLAVTNPELQSAREKMPFEVTPLFLNLSRISTQSATAATPAYPAMK